eukprot:7579709-Karenia_brevis.AAC.1
MELSPCVSTSLPDCKRRRRDGISPPKCKKDASSWTLGAIRILQRDTASMLGVLQDIVRRVAVIEKGSTLDGANQDFLEMPPIS